MNKPLLNLHDVQFSWPTGQTPLIDIAALQVQPGERLFISGASGSGKSTLLSLIGGVVVPSRGQIEVLSTDLGKLSGAQRDRFRADHLGIIFQQFNLVPYLSILQNVILPCEFSAQRRARLKQTGLTPEQEALRLIEQLEIDREHLSGRAVVDLSFGQQQRVAVARALIGAPELIVADEPTSALDEAMSLRFVQLLVAETQATNTGVIFVSHDTRIADHFDRHIRFESLNSAVQWSQNRSTTT